MADINALIEAKKFAEAQAAIAAARRGGELSGAEARALGAKLDAAKPAPKAKGRK